jgi:hypothetical protein
VDRKDGTRPSNLTKKEVSVKKGNILVFAFFLLLSFVFWYLNSLGKDLETDIKYPVRYSNIPDNRTLTNNSPARLNLFLKGPGYSILRLKMSGRNTPVVIDFSKIRYKRVQNSKSNDYYIVASDLIPNFNAQLKSVCKISSIKPDTLFFSYRQTLK